MNNMVKKAKPAHAAKPDSSAKALFKTADCGSSAACLCHHQNLILVAKTVLPTKYGAFNLWAYQEKSGPTHLALFVGKVEGAERVPVRLHSECVTGDALGSLRCDCGPQLEKAMRQIQAGGLGVLIHLDQEGRGIGLANKMKAYALQDQGHDTVEANLLLGFAEDRRDYSSAACILGDLGVKSVLLITNNPKKIEGLEKCGIRIEGRLPLLIAKNPHNERYLATKKEKMRHLID